MQKGKVLEFKPKEAEGEKSHSENKKPSGEPSTPQTASEKIRLGN
ncbi:MAG TPA: hypothetical protein VMW42_01795 [Desulfatiglandales bacterium]|nr:hypothetical protein [Desulfatiglandales bacterium]